MRERDALAELFGFAALKSRPLLVLGEGSNILFTRDWPGVVLSIATRGIAVLDADAERARIRVEAGENWNDFVHWSIGQGFAGLENLVAIPGTVGAAPMQNIGAYGVEVREFVDTRRSLGSRTPRASSRSTNADCAFAYRDSVFKRDAGSLRRSPRSSSSCRARARCASTTPASREELAALGVSEPRPASVAEAITRIRMRKLPNPHRRSATPAASSRIRSIAGRRRPMRCATHPAAPIWPAGDGAAKLSAAWLVEACGFKGLREGDAGVSSAARAGAGQPRPRDRRRDPCARRAHPRGRARAVRHRACSPSR